MPGLNIFDDSKKEQDFTGTIQNDVPVESPQTAPVSSNSDKETEALWSLYGDKDYDWNSPITIDKAMRDAADKIAPAPRATTTEKSGKEFTLEGGLGAVKDVAGGIITQALPDTAVGIARLFDDPDTRNGALDEFIERGEKRSQKYQKSTGSRDIAIPFTDVTREELRSGVSSLGFSGASMLSSKAGEVTGGALGSFASPFLGPASAVVGKGVGSFLGGAAAGYKIDKHQFTQQYREFLENKKGRRLTDKEWKEVKAGEIADHINKHALHEAGWEGLGNAIGLGLFNKIKGKSLGKKALKSFAEFVGVELMGEAQTQIGQTNEEVALGMRPESDKRSYTSLKDQGKSIREVLPATLLLAGTGAGGKYAYEKLSNIEGENKKKTPPEVIEKAKKILSIKKQNLPTRDLIHIKNSEEILGKIGLGKGDIDAILQDRYDDLENARLNLESKGPVSRTAAKTIAQEQAEIVLAREEERKKSQDKADKELIESAVGDYVPELPEIRKRTRKEKSDDIAVQAEDNDVLYDFIDQAVSAQDSEDIKRRKNHFEKLLEQHNKNVADKNKAELDVNSLGAPSDAKTAAEIFAQNEPTKEMLEAEFTGSEREFKEKKRNERREGAKEVFQDLTPTDIKPGIEEIEQEVKGIERSTVISSGTGNDQTVTGRTPAVSPEWIKQKNIKAYDKKNGTNLSRLVNSKSVLGVIEKVRSGKELTLNQQKVFDYISDVAREKIAGGSREIASNNEFAKLEKEGFEFKAPEKIAVSDIKPGDEVVIDKAGMPDKLVHKGFDKDGNAILQDGVMIHADPFDTVEIIADKKAGKITEEDDKAVSDFIAKIADSSVEDIDLIKKESDAFFKAAPRFKPYRQLIESAIEKREAVLSERPVKEKIKETKSSVSGQEITTKPTEKQKEAGNYKKGHVKFDGLDISIENPIGSERSGTDKSGNKWSVKMQSDYGYIKGSTGYDKDHVDVFISPGYTGGANKVHIVNQYNSDGTFDEHKVVIGSKNRGAAKRAYLGNFEKGWKGGKSVVEMSMDDFKKWVFSDAPKKGQVNKQSNKKAVLKQVDTESKASAIKPQSNKSYGKDNKIFTEDAAAKARELLKSKLGNLNSGIDPELMQAGITIAGYHIEAGARTFTEYSKAMISDLGEVIRPFLRSFYEGVRHYPGFDSSGMSSASEIDKDESHLEKAKSAKKVRKITEKAFRTKLKKTGSARDATGKDFKILIDDDRKTYYLSVVEDGMRMKKGPAGVAQWTLGDAIEKAASMAYFGEIVSDIKESSTDTETEVDKKTYQEASEQVANKVRDSLKNKEKITAKALFRWSKEAHGGTQSEGKFTPKDAYDALELGINKFLESERGISWNPSDTTSPSLYLESLERDVMSLIPTQTKRTAEMDEFQQFSTPPPLAFMANWVSKPTKDDVYLEPSAGIGGLAVFGKNAGATVIVNELSDRRRKLLSKMNFDRVTGENAEHLNSILPADIKPTVIVMNPPFSATAGRIKGKRATQIGAQHVEQALKRLEDGGRLVAIVGEGMAMNKPAFRKWWGKIKGEYNVKANIGVSGKGYRKYGTTFNNQIVVIDKTGPTTDNVITGNVDYPSQLVPLLEDIRNERRKVQQKQGGAGSEADNSQELGGTSRFPEKGPVVPVPTDTNGNNGVRPEIQTELRNGDGLRTDTGKSNAVGGPGKSGQSGSEVGSDRGESVKRPSDSGNVTGGSGVGTVTSPGDSNKRGGEWGTTEGDVFELAFSQVENSDYSNVDLTDSVYEKYIPEKVKIKGAHPHPAPLVQSAAMSAVSLPDPTYSPSIPLQKVKSGVLSDAQLEAIVYAGQAHSKMLQNGERRGFFIGDGTGVGKGREVAGIILDNWNKGRKKAVWISSKQSLFKDAQRDIGNIKWKPDLLFNLSKVKPANSITSDEGILFTTYDTLKSGAKQGSDKTRLDQVVEWFGKDFDGVIIFDESHNMGNAVEKKGKRGSTKASQKALAGVDLQAELPNARVVYLSATGATDVSNFAYAERLGLWGEGTAFANKNDFIEQVSSGGTAAMELVARDMKAMGSYIARSISYDGVEYDRLEHDLNADQHKAYNVIARAWQKVLSNVNEAIGTTGTQGRERGQAYSAFWGANQRFFNQLITTMQLPSMLKSIRKDLKRGDSVVIQVDNTFEAATERGLSKLEEGMSLDDLDISPFEDLMSFVEKSFPVVQYEEYEDENGNIRTRPVVDSEGNEVLNAEAVAMREKLLDELGSIRGMVADNPLDQIFDEFGVDNVAEVTGRKRRIVRINKDGIKQRVIQKRGKRSSDADVSDFMNGKKRILIFSRAGGTGSSYHADNEAKNKSKRIHYLLQPGWTADAAVQGLGRTHRSNQKQPPKYILVTTNLKGQKRFLSSIARRLEQLGALTKGQRQTGNQGIFSERDNLESPIAREALRKFFKDLAYGGISGMSVVEFQEQTGLKIMSEEGGIKEELPEITQFLNRMLSLEVESQDIVFDAFSNKLDAVIAAHAKAGTLDVGLETLKADSVKKTKDVLVYKDNDTGAETRYVTLNVTNPAPRLEFKMSGQYAKHGYFVNKRSGKIWAVMTRQMTNRKTGVVEPVKILTSVSYKTQKVSVKDFTGNKFTKLSKNEAERLWNKELSEAPKTVERTEHVITGALLPVWDKLGHSSARVIRVQTDNGERMLGRIVSKNDIKSTLTNLGVDSSGVKTTKDISAKEIFDRVFNDGDKVILSDGTRIERRVVSNEERIEVSGIPYNKITHFEKYGLFSERINWKTRHFIPVNDYGVRLIEKIISRNGVQDITSKNEDRVLLSSSTNKLSKSEQANIKDELESSLGKGSIENLKKAGVEIIDHGAVSSFGDILDIVKFSTSKEVDEFRKRNNIGPLKLRKSGGHPTQIATTKSTYKKIQQLMPENEKNGVIVDFGAGKGVGAKAIGAKTFEPMPDNDFSPDYKKSESIPTGYADAVISNAVLNVVPDDIRDNILNEMFRILKVGGRMYINAMGNDVFNSRHHVISKSNKEVIVSSSNAYQKGFTTGELKEYIKSIFGDTVEITVPKKKIGSVFVVVTKKSNTTQFPGTWHGTSVKFRGGFSLDKILSGNGKAYFGYGITVTENRRIAGKYKGEQGEIKRTEIDSKLEKFLDWDTPIENQSDSVLDSLAGVEVLDQEKIDNGDYKGSDLYFDIKKEYINGTSWARKISSDIKFKLPPNHAYKVEADKFASDYLNYLGIDGVRYRSLDGSSTFTVFASDKVWIIEILYSKDGKRIEGFHVPGTGKTYLIQGNIKKGEALKVLSHELGVHADKLGFKDSKKFSDILNLLEKRSKQDTKEGEAIRKAFAAVPHGTLEEHKSEEALAYLISNSPEISIVRRFIAAIKKFLVDHGVHVKIFRNIDLQALALAVVKEKSAGQQENITSDIVNVDVTKTPQFKKWFGKSKIKDKSGKPLVVYHGSTTFGVDDNSWIFENDHSYHNSTNSPLAGIGTFFTADRNEASGYARGGSGTVNDVFLKLENPLIIESWNIPQFRDKLEAAAWAKRQKELKGYDGVIVADEGHLIIFDSNQAKSVSINSGAFDINSNDIRYSVGKEDSSTIDLLESLINNSRLREINSEKKKRREKIDREKKEFLEETIKTAKDVVNMSVGKPDLGFFGKIFSSPEYFFEKSGATRRMFAAQMDRRDRKFDLENIMFAKDKNDPNSGFVSYMSNLKKKRPAIYKSANRYLLKTDRSGVGFGIKYRGDSFVVTDPKGKKVSSHSVEKDAVTSMMNAEADYLKDKGYSKSTVEAIMVFRQMTNNAFDILSEDMRRIADSKEGAQKGFVEVFDYVDQYSVNDNSGKTLKSFSKRLNAVKFVEEQNIKGLRIKKENKKIKKNISVNEAIAAMGDLRGTYFPRKRQSGKFIAKAINNKTGEKQLKKFDMVAFMREKIDPVTGEPIKRAAVAKKIADLINNKSVSLVGTPLAVWSKEMKKNGFSVSVELDQSVGESVFDVTGLSSSIDAILNSASSKVNTDKYGVPVEAARHINNILANNIADIFKNRGYLSSRTRRSKQYWSGFEEDMLLAGVSYVKGIAGGVSKKEAATKMVKAITGRDVSFQEWSKQTGKKEYDEYLKFVDSRRLDPGKQSGLFAEAKTWMSEVLRNQERADRIIGILKGLAVLKFLGFRVSSAAVNMTNMALGVPATISSRSGESITKSLNQVRRSSSAYFKYRTGISKNKEDKSIFIEISNRGWDDAQFNHDAAGVLRSQVGNLWNDYFVGPAVYMFGATEKANRAMTIHAAYKQLMKSGKYIVDNDGMLSEKALQEAKKISDRAHGVYGKETVPTWTQGRVNPLKLLYTFQKFSHNYILNAYEMGYRGDYKQALYMMFSPAILAGATASLPMSILFGALTAAGGGEDSEEEFYKWLGTFGDSFETLGRQGIAGLAGVSLKGSLQVNNPMPRNLKEVLGAPGAVVFDLYEAADKIKKKEYAKALEKAIPTGLSSPIKAIREYREGVTTGSYSPVYYGEMPLRGTFGDAVARFFSFSPARLSGIREKQWHEKKVLFRFRDQRRDINSFIKHQWIKFDGNIPDTEMAEIAKTVYAYNEKVIGLNRPDIKPITIKSIRAMLKRFSKPSRLEINREVKR